MEFKRIDKDTVNCIITEDDMFEQGIKLEDLFEKKKEAMELSALIGNGMTSTAR